MSSACNWSICFEELHLFCHTYENVQKMSKEITATGLYQNCSCSMFLAIISLTYI